LVESGGKIEGITMAMCSTFAVITGRKKFSPPKGRHHVHGDMLFVIQYKRSLKLVCNVNIVYRKQLSRLCPETSTKLYVHEFGFCIQYTVHGREGSVHLSTSL
jgi:hypothetical protein